MIYPKALQPGDTIGIIASASPPNMDSVSNAIHFFETIGLKVKLGQYIDHVHGYLAGTDEERLLDFHTMIKDQTVKAIIFAAGGYGTGRIAQYIDYELIKQNPKIIWGYSDITYLHIAVRQQIGLVTFHGPMASSEIGKANFDEKSAFLFQQLFEEMKLQYTKDISPLTVINKGKQNKVTGRLTGGNLSLIISTIGTPFEIETDDMILLIEDVDEEPYQVDSMLNQLELAGKLAGVVAIIVGDFARAEPKKGRSSLLLADVFDDYFKKLTCPVVAGFKIGHCLPHYAIPLGAEAVLDVSKKTLSIEPGVTTRN